MKPLSVIVDCSGGVRGGIYRVLEQLEQNWNPEDSLTLIAAPEGFVPTHARVHSYQNAGRAKTLLSASRSVAELAKKSRADGLLSLSPSLTASLSRVPLVTILHDLAYLLWPAEISTSQRRYRRLAYESNLRRSGVIRCVSQRTLHDLRGQMRWARDVAKVWPLPTPQLIATPDESDLVRDLASAGVSRPVVVPGHSEHKGVELAIGGLAHLPPDVGMIIATRPDLVAKFEALASANSVGNRVHYAVGLPDAEYGALLRDSAVVAMPSHFEGLGLPVLEARSFGARIVISPDPALLEASAGTATRMSTWTSRAFADAVSQCLEQPRPAAFDDPRSWTQAANELREDFLTLRSGGS